MTTKKKAGAESVTQEETKKPARKLKGNARQVKKKAGRPKGRRTSAQAKREKRDRDILELQAKGVSIRKTADAIGCAPSTVQRVIDKWKPVLKELAEVEDFRDIKTDFLDAGQFRIFKSMMTDEILAKMTVNGGAYAMRQLYDMGRLERGQSTANVQQAIQYTRVDKTKVDSE